MILSCRPITRGGILSRLSAFAAASPKRCLTPSLGTLLLRSDVATASLRLRTRLKSFANFHGTNENGRALLPLAHSRRGYDLCPRRDFSSVKPTTQRARPLQDPCRV